MSVGRPLPKLSADELRAIPRRRLEGDWFAVDAVGRIALFIGGDAGPLPEAAAIGATESALRALDVATEARRAALRTGQAYRGAGYRAAEPIFDLPRTLDAEPLHDSPFSGYPHLVFGRDGLREAVIDIQFREALVREDDGFALLFRAGELGPILHAHLHEHNLCRGCRALDLEDEPRLRAPEVVATSGLYAYLHPVESALWSEHDYFRVCSPSIPANEADLEAVVVSSAKRVVMPFRFEDTKTVTAAQIRASGTLSEQ